MTIPIDVREIDLSAPVPTLTGLTGNAAELLVRWHTVPVGRVRVAVKNGRCAAGAIQQAICEQLDENVVTAVVRRALPALAEQDLSVPETWLSVTESITPDNDSWPLVTVAVCTRNRTDSLRRCLTALRRLDYPHLDLLIVDNAPDDDATATLVAEAFPEMRYVCQPVPGLNWARNLAIEEARGEIVAFTDDDVIVDQGWVQALARLFRENADVAAVTGLVLPYELQTEAQQLFELYGGFERGFKREWTRGNRAWAGFNGRFFIGSGRFGTGANMAFRKSIFTQIGYFDPALDVGTITNGGGDLDMFFRVIHEGLTLVYEPRAMVWHRHRQSYDELRTQIINNGIGFYAHVVRNLLAYPREWRGILYLMIWWWLWWYARRFLLSFKPSFTFPRTLILAEFWGTFRGLTRYQRARRRAARLAAAHNRALPPVRGRPFVQPEHQSDAWLVHQVELSEKITALPGAEAYQGVLAFVTWRGTLLGSVEFRNYYHPVSRQELLDGLANALAPEILAAVVKMQKDAAGELLTRLLVGKEGVGETAVSSTWTPLSPDQSVSVVISTYDRPEVLRRCLRHLQQQQTRRDVELIVVDNHPASGLTAPVVADFPQVIYVAEERPGLSYARNAGIVASHGDIVVCTDDDVVMPPDWLERLVAPFREPEVMAVTGNVLPYKLENRAQQLFERYGGLGRGFEPRRADSNWFTASSLLGVRTWELGATANAAFRASIYDHPQIGLLEESLGAGSPTGCSEDTFAFHQILRAGFTIIYEPTAFVWHEHRQTEAALRNQLFNYSKGHVAYHLLTWLKQNDWRGLFYLLVQIPFGHVYRLALWLLRQTDYPLAYHLLEMWGQLLGPWALWQSIRRVRRLGRSEPYVSADRRREAATVLACDNKKIGRLNPLSETTVSS